MTQISNLSYLKLALRALGVWLITSVLMFIYGDALFRLLAPFMDYVLNSISSDLHGKIFVATNDSKQILQANALLLNDLYIQGIPVAPKGYQLAAATELIHNLVPIVILITGLLSWPLKSLQERLILVSLGIPTLALILGLTVPPLLLGHLEATCFNAAQNLSTVELEKPLIMHWVVFLEVGGRWLLPLVALAFCILWLNLISRSTDLFFIHDSSALANK